ncbi:MAG: hypothetical protein IPJ77_20960 [Planctomycetes bacterium]|nr:hypothetical protein [Planctomycetota bacterium]
MLPHAAVVLALAASGPAPSVLSGHALVASGPAPRVVTGSAASSAAPRVERGPAPGAVSVPNTIVARAPHADAAPQAGALRPRLERVELVGLASSIAPAPTRKDAPSAALSDGSVCLGERRFVFEAVDAAPEGSPPAPPPRLVAREAAGKELWSIELGRAPAPDEPGAYLWAPRRPNATESAPLALQQDGDTLLACAPNGDLLRVNADGKVLAKLERVWEFERGFIGPSVWSHHLARFGVEDFDAQDRTPHADLAAHAEYARALDRARAEETAGVVGGPIVAGTHVFVAVASAKKGSWSAYLGKGRVYELDHDLRPLGVVELPRVPLGSLATADAAGVVWALPNSGLARIATTPQQELWAMGPGGWDRVPHVPWTKELRVTEREAWLATDPAWRGVLFADGFALTVPDGGFVARESEPVVRFTLVRVRLTDGAERALELRVPYEGELARPTTNFSGTGTSVRAMGPYGLGLTVLERSGSRLVAHLATTASHWTVEFELARVLGE